MFKNFIYTIFILLFFAVTPAFSADFKILDIKTDNSENAVMLKGNISSASVNYKAGFSENPLRAYIDLDDCIFVGTKKSIELKNSPIKKIVIAQYSAKPNKVRIVFYANTMSDLRNIKLIKNGNALTFKLDNFVYSGSKVPVIFADILPKQYSEGKNIPTEKLKFSRYILTGVHQTNSGLLLSGVGSIKLSRPFILKNPIRIVFDLQNANVYSKEFYGEYKLKNGDIVKIGQFNSNTLRFVVTTNTPVDYKSFISPDLQSIHLTNIKEPQQNVLLNSNVPSSIKRVSINAPTGNETYVTIEFTEPVIHALRRTYNKLLLDFLNVNFEINQNVIKAFKTPQFGGFQVDKMSVDSDKLALLLPVSDNLKVETGMAQDGKLIAIKLTGVLEIANPAEIKLPTTPLAKSKTALPLKNKVIVVDAGHGGKDSGAISGSKYEKIPALKMALLLQKNLEEQGAKVIMTRSDDTFITLQDRVTISNYENADLFISIHLNSSEKSNINGIETHWYKENSKALAKYVQDSIMKDIKANDRGLFKSMFYVINHTNAPAILVETGFISNPQERDELFGDARQKATAKAICNGILEYYKKK